MEHAVKHYESALKLDPKDSQARQNLAFVKKIMQQQQKSPSNQQGDRDKDSKDNKLYLGPIWDFNLAFGNADYCQGGSYTGWGWDFNSYCNGDWWLIPKVSNNEFEILFICGKLPVPKEERMVAMAKRAPRKLPVFNTLLFFKGMFSLFFI